MDPKKTIYFPSFVKQEAKHLAYSLPYVTGERSIPFCFIRTYGGKGTGSQPALRITIRPVFLIELSEVQKHHLVKIRKRQELW